MSRKLLDKRSTARRQIDGYTFGYDRFKRSAYDYPFLSRNGLRLVRFVDVADQLGPVANSKLLELFFNCEDGHSIATNDISRYREFNEELDGQKDRASVLSLIYLNSKSQAGYI